MTLNLTAREREYLCVIADVKHENSELRYEIDRLKAEALAADIRIANDKLEFQRIYAVLRSHAVITQKAEAEREAVLSDAKRLTTAIKAAIERLRSNPAIYLTTSVADKLQIALEGRP